MATNRHISQMVRPGAAGNIEHTIKSYAVMDAANDGANHFSIKTIIPTTAVPVGSENEIEIRLTDSDFHVIQFNDSFLTLDLSVSIMVNRALIDSVLAAVPEGSPEREVLDHQFLFVGLKSGSQLLREYYCVHRGQTIDGTRQNNATPEAFLMNLYKPKSEKNNRKHIHSLYSEVHACDTSACGTYVPLTALKVGVPITFEMSVSIPVDDIALLQGFNEYPVALFGDLILKFRINPEALVYCRVDPISSGVKHLLTRYTDTSISGAEAAHNTGLRTFFDKIKDAINVPGSLYTHQYTQIGCPSYQFQLCGMTPEVRLEGDLLNFIPTVQSVQTLRCSMTVAGYRATPECLKSLTEYFTANPFVVPSQRVEIKSLSSGPYEGGFNTCQANIPLNHVSDFILLFPKDSKQITCFENPMYSEVQLSVAHRNIPERPVKTCGDPLFFQLMLNASDLDSVFECTDEYEDSLTLPRASKTRIVNPRTDVTSFAVTLPVERSGSGGIYFDGIHSNGANMAIELRGVPLFPRPHDTYCYPCIHPSVTPVKNNIPPILCTLQNTFWFFSARNGGECNFVHNWTADEALHHFGYKQ